MTHRSEAPHGRRWFELAFRWACLAVLATSVLGCRGSTTPDRVEPSSDASTKEPTAESAGLRLLVIDDPALAKSISRQWQAMTGEAMDVTERTAAEYEASQAEPLAVDIVIYPTGLLGTLAERNQVAPLPNDVLQNSTFRRRDLLSMVRLRETVWGETVYAVPLAAPQFTLLYRQDLFEKLQLQPPRSWTEYAETARKLADRAALGDAAPPADRPWSGTLEPWGPGWSGLMYLARAAAYARHPNQYSTLFDFGTLEPRLTSPPFVRALDELRAIAPAAGADRAVTMGPEEVRRAIAAGECGMAITWPSPYGGTSGAGEGTGADAADSAGDADGAASTAKPASSATSEVGSRLRVARLPGSVEVYNVGESKWERRGEDDAPHVSLLGVSGRLASVTRSSLRGRAAFNFLVLLSSAEWHPRVLTASPAAGLFRASHAAEPRGWMDEFWSSQAAAEYGRLVEQIQKEDGWLLAPRLPGRGAYLAALDECVGQSVRGDGPSDQALAAAAERWNAITNERGRTEQRRAYRRCLGLEK